MLSKLDQKDYRDVHNARPLWQGTLSQVLAKELGTTYELISQVTDPVQLGRLQGRIALIRELRDLPAEAEKVLNKSAIPSGIV